METSRKKVGLALGGGGAKGLAHIGVIKALKEMGIPIDYVAGTSMGSLVAAWYALTGEVKSLEEAIDKLEGHDRYLITEIVRKGEKPLLKNHSVLSILDHHFGNHTFADTKIPFKAVATDMKTGDEVILDHGLINDAVKASTCIPVVFCPVEIEGKMLIDGGLANPIPADVVREMGADVVIAVDVSGRWMDVTCGVNGAIRWKHIYTIFEDMLAAVTHQISREILKTADVVLHPPVLGHDWLSFTEARDIIYAGYREAWDNANFICLKSGYKKPTKTLLQAFIDFITETD